MVNDPKEIAEHLMLIDLGGNDVGRIAEPGSVVIMNNLELKIQYVMHMVSNVEAEIKRIFLQLMYLKQPFLQEQSLEHLNESHGDN